MAARGRDRFLKFKPLMLFLSRICAVFPMRTRKRWFAKYRRTTGVKGIAIRYILLKAIAKTCGDNVSIHPDCYIFEPDRLELGNNVSIHPMCYLDATGGMVIGNDVSIAHGVTIMTTSHNYDKKEMPIKDQLCLQKKTVVEDNVWIGAKTTVLCGRRIGTGAVVGAGAVVTKDIPAYAVAAGVPAAVIKER